MSLCNSCFADNKVEKGCYMMTDVKECKDYIPKDCSTCKYGIDKECKHPEDRCHYDGFFTDWKPKEKPMENKVIFESEEDAKKIIETIFGTAFSFVEQDGKVYIDRLKQKGYIRKSAVEEAEEMYNKVSNTSPDKNQIYYLLEVIDKHKDAIQELKAENERYKSKYNCKMEIKK